MRNRVKKWGEAVSCASAKVFHLQNDGLHLTAEQVHFYLGDFHNNTKLIPNVVKISRTQYLNFGKMNGGYSMVLEKGKQYCLYIFTQFGYIPVVPVADEQMSPNGFVMIEDTFFDEEFEKIVLDKEKK